MLVILAPAENNFNVDHEVEAEQCSGNGKNGQKYFPPFILVIPVEVIGNVDAKDGSKTQYDHKDGLRSFSMTILHDANAKS